MVSKQRQRFSSSGRNSAQGGKTAEDIKDNPKNKTGLKIRLPLRDAMRQSPNRSDNQSHDFATSKESKRSANQSFKHSIG